MTPDELEAAIERHGLRVVDETGVIYNLLADRWQISTDMDVNYMVTAEKPRVDLRMIVRHGSGLVLALGAVHPHRRRRPDRRATPPSAS